MKTDGGFHRPRNATDDWQTIKTGRGETDFPRFHGGGSSTGSFVLNFCHQSYKAVPFCLFSLRFVVPPYGSSGTQAVQHNCLLFHLHRPALGWKGPGILAVGSLKGKPGATGRRNSILLTTPTQSRVTGVEFAPPGSQEGRAARALIPQTQ